MVVQYIIVAVIVVAAVFYIGRSVYRSSKGKACESGSCGCERESLHKRST